MARKSSDPKVIAERTTEIEKDMKRLKSDPSSAEIYDKKTGDSLELYPDERFVDLYNGDGETLISNYGRVVDYKSTVARRSTKRIDRGKIVIELKRTWTLGTLNASSDSTYYKISNNGNNNYYVHRAVWFSFANEAILNKNFKEIPDMWDKSIFLTGIRPKVKYIPEATEILKKSGLDVDSRLIYTPQEVEELEKPVEPSEMLKYLFETKKPDENEAAAFEVHHKNEDSLKNVLSELQLLKNFKELDRLNNDGKPYKQHAQLTKESDKLEELTGAKIVHSQVVASGNVQDFRAYQTDEIGIKYDHVDYKNYRITPIMIYKSATFLLSEATDSQAKKELLDRIIDKYESQKPEILARNDLDEASKRIYIRSVVLDGIEYKVDIIDNQNEE